MPSEATSDTAYSRSSSCCSSRPGGKQGSNSGRTQMIGSGTSSVGGRRRRRPSATGPGSSGQRGAAAAKGSRKGLGDKLNGLRLDFGRPDVQACLRHLASERKLSLQASLGVAAWSSPGLMDLL